MRRSASRDGLNFCRAYADTGKCPFQEKSGYCRFNHLTKAQVEEARKKAAKVKADPKAKAKPKGKGKGKGKKKGRGGRATPAEGSEAEEDEEWFYDDGDYEGWEE